MYKVDIKNIGNSEIEITGEIAGDTFESHRKEAVKKISEKFDIPGFRKGNVPENILITKLGETPILEEMAERALSKAYPTIISENKIEAIGRPEVSITKIASKNPLGFKIKTAVMPEIKLPDYKTISKEFTSVKEDPIEVSEKEMEDVIMEIRKQRSKEGAEKSSDNKEDESNLPVFNDEFVKTLGDFKDTSTFKAKLKENMIAEKKAKAQSKKRADIIDKIVSQSKIELPNIVVESELDKMASQFESDVTRMGLNFNEYLKYIKKTIEDLRKEWRPEAEKRAKIQLALNKMAIQENITISKEELDKEVKHILEHYKDASPHNVAIYVETTLSNEKVFQLLEEQK